MNAISSHAHDLPLLYHCLPLPHSHMHPSPFLPTSGWWAPLCPPPLSTSRCAPRSRVALSGPAAGNGRVTREKAIGRYSISCSSLQLGRHLSSLSTLYPFCSLRQWVCAFCSLRQWVCGTCVTVGVSVCYSAFDTPTGLPYGTINLLYGIPPGEIPITCTACCASFVVEFGTLSRLTGVSVGAGHAHCGRGCTSWC